MKKTVCFMALMLAVCSACVKAQNEERPQGERPKMDKTEMAQKRTDEMAKQYGLSEKQTKKLLEVNKEYAEKMRPMGRPPRRPDNGQSTDNQVERKQPLERPNNGNMDDMRKKMDSEREAYNAKVKKIMTDEQYSKFEQDQKKMGPARGQRPPQDGQRPPQEKKDE